MHMALDKDAIYWLWVMVGRVTVMLLWQFSVMSLILVTRSL